ncbi:MAG: rhodanese-like domain-containing protein, partial [Bacteroidota bacterium]
MKEITPAELKERLQAGEALTVLDIREADEYAEWHIRGSMNIPVYNALNAGEVSPLTEQLHQLPSDRPVVAVCRAGYTSRAAADILESSGFAAFSLRGGMRLWSGVWSEANVPLPSLTEAQLVQVRRNAKGCLSYLLASQGEAFVVDPCVDASAYAAIAKRLGARITRVAETHVHADHLSRAQDLCGTSGAQLMLPANNRVRYPFTPLHGGDTLTIGAWNVTVHATPGHTEESVCYSLNGKALLTGDTLFVSGIGRPDLEKGNAGAGDGAARLYESLKTTILGFDNGMLILPGHDSRPIGLDGQAVAARLGELRPALKRLAAGRDEFVAAVLGSLGA